MNRRCFLQSAASAAASVSLCPATFSDIGNSPTFADSGMRFSAPLEWFPGLRPEDKLEHVARWGLAAYEWLWPIGDADKIREKACALGLEISCMAGTGAIAEGWMVAPEDHDKVFEMLRQRIAMAKQLNCRRLIGLTGNSLKGTSAEAQTESVITCLKRLAPLLEDSGMILVMEALNPLVDHKGFFITRTDQTIEILQAVGSPNVKMLFDIYHQQITEGNVIRNIRENIAHIGHFHVADNPGRNEPGTGELNYTNIFRAIRESGYTDFIALECGHSTGNYENTLRATLKCLL